MDVKIVTMNSEYNYGAMLQAYSLQETIKSLGHTVEFIDQRKETQRKIELSRKNKEIFKNIFKIIYRKPIEKGYRNFEEFIGIQHLTKENYFDYSKLIENPPKADVFLTGSDQVWNPISLKPIHFLDFADKNAKKISYAASLGQSAIPENKINQFQKYLNSFDSISVREESSKKQLSQLTSKEVNVNIDPAFLFNKYQWKELSRPVTGLSRPFILCYILYRPKWLNKYLTKLHKKTGFQIVLIDNSAFRQIYCNRYIRDAGPQEFLWLFNNAEMIITSSFHGTAFSALFNKKFFTIVNPAAPSRISDLTKTLHLSETILSSDDRFEFPEIDYTKTNEIIEKEKKKAIEYLKNSI